MMKPQTRREAEQYRSADLMAKAALKAESEGGGDINHKSMSYCTAAFAHLEDSSKYPKKRAAHLMMSRMASHLAMKELAA